MWTSQKHKTNDVASSKQLFRINVEPISALNFNNWIFDSGSRKNGTKFQNFTAKFCHLAANFFLLLKSKIRVGTVLSSKCSITLIRKIACVTKM